MHNVGHEASMRPFFVIPTLLGCKSKLKKFVALKTPRKRLSRLWKL
jgi:hypothetical protein